ncbi:MAG: serine/threonine-protein kinase, partial [Candidatus Polarisedimenticolia bacterium]
MTDVTRTFGSAGPSGPGGGVPAARLEPGTRLGTRYEIEALLGEGGMGTVYRARDLELGRTVALKVIRREMAARPEILERFKREILLASQVTHRHVLRLHDLGVAGEILFISMQYVEGTDLKTLLRTGGPLPIGRALELARPLAEALQAAHDAGVVHRDLKPQNVLIDGEGRPYIADFGISRSLDSGSTMTETGAIIGTVDYMAPEQARGDTPDHRGDIYAFGVMLYEMLTGELPFRAPSPLSVMMKRVHETAPGVRRVRPEVPAWLSGIVARALERDPALRYQSARDLLHDIDRRRARRAWKRLLRPRVLLPAAGVLLLAAAALAGARFLRPG